MRSAEIRRRTAETDITLTLCLDGAGKSEVHTGVGFLDHMLTLFAAHGRFDLSVACRGDTDIFIYPPYRFKVADGLVTNFHLPESTLIMLVAAFTSREKILELYELAVREKYRFFSFGDAMLIL